MFLHRSISFDPSDKLGSIDCAKDDDEVLQVCCRVDACCYLSDIHDRAASTNSNCRKMRILIEGETPKAVRIVDNQMVHLGKEEEGRVQLFAVELLVGAGVCHVAVVAKQGQVVYLASVDGVRPCSTSNCEILRFGDCAVAEHRALADDVWHNGCLLHRLENSVIKL